MGLISLMFDKQFDCRVSDLGVGVTGQGRFWALAPAQADLVLLLLDRVLVDGESCISCHEFHFFKKQASNQPFPTFLITLHHAFHSFTIIHPQK